MSEDLRCALVAEADAETPPRPSRRSAGQPPGLVVDLYGDLRQRAGVLPGVVRAEQ